MTLIQARDIMVHPVCLAPDRALFRALRLKAGRRLCLSMFVHVCLSRLLTCRDRINYTVLYQKIFCLYHITRPASTPSQSLPVSRIDYHHGACQ